MSMLKTTWSKCGRFTSILVSAAAMKHAYEHCTPARCGGDFFRDSVDGGNVTRASEEEEK